MYQALFKWAIETICLLEGGFPPIFPSELIYFLIQKATLGNCVRFSELVVTRGCFRALRRTTIELFVPGIDEIALRRVLSCVI